MEVSGFRINWIIAILLFPVISLGQIKVSNITDTLVNIEKEGLIYNLPRTRLVFDFIVTKTIMDKGPFSEYAKDFLGIENVINRNSVEYAITNIKITAVSEPDPSQFYFVERYKKFPWICKKDAFIQITPQGFLLSYNQFIKIESSEGRKNNEKYFGTNLEQDNAKNNQLPFYHINDALLSKKETIAKVDSSIRPPMRRPVYKVNGKELSSTEKARIALEDLATIRENRQNLASGYQEVAYESGTMTQMINQLNAQEKELLEQFTGISKSETTSFRLSYLPSVTDTTAYPLAWFSKQKGIVQSQIDDAMPVNVRLSTFVPVNDSIQRPKLKRSPKGLVYRVPAITACNISVGNDLIYSGQQIINHFGKCMRLPKQVKRAVFYPETGGIKSSR